MSDFLRRQSLYNGATAENMEAILLTDYLKENNAGHLSILHTNGGVDN
jgi:hypothetical protein